MRFFSRKACSSVIIIFCSFCFELGTSRDTISSSHFIKDPETISSNRSLFTLGFFSPQNSTHRYVGIWYMSKSAIVWVANRNQPLRDSSGIVTISEDGNLVVLNGQKHIIWSSNVSNLASNTSCQLLDSGNLVLLDNAASGTIIWQSFQHPSDTHLLNMKISSNKRTGEKLKITSWKTPSDPSMGDFYLSLERLNLAELFVWNGSRPYWRSGPWNGRVFLGMYMTSSYKSGASVVTEGDGTVSYSFTVEDRNDIQFLAKLNSEGKILEKVWDVVKKQWQMLGTLPKSACDVYGKCGEFGYCNSNSTPICSCLEGFEPSNRDQWNRQNWIGGCVRRTALQCERVKNGSAYGEEDGFLKRSNVKPPDFAEWSSSSQDTCRSQCLKNCTCVAYSYDTQIGCISWSGNLIDTQQFSEGGVDLYIRIAYSDLEKEREKSNMSVIIIITIITGTIIFVTCAYFLWKWIAKHSGKSSDSFIGELSQVKFQELLAYDIKKVVMATNNFHESNKLGQGGFGPVYKGKLQDGQDIAIKRLSRASGQGLEEFKNEIVVISRLQHCNLVRLIGYCVEGEEKMLIYEYMPNKSLDAFIFDASKHQVLDWQKRFRIIDGVARGILYLHRDSRLKIIHRDLKASNILLDENLTPKISDFGMARIFGRSEDQANTKKIVGTYGYMAPEYAMEGLFSEKSDVFSFGVLVLEIVSGRRNTSFYKDEHFLNLLGFAWKFWNEGNVLALIDPEMFDPILEEDIMRCIHIGLLCVQDLARERPTMSTVISMLNSEIKILPPPKQPAFVLWQGMLSVVSPKENEFFSNNGVSITDIQAR